MKFKCRASALGQIMTNPRAKKDQQAGKLSESAKQFVREYMIAQRFGRKKITNTSAMLKGTEAELDSANLLAELRGIKKLWKNDEYYENESFTGTPDIIEPEEVIDIKSSFDIFTFHKAEPPLTLGGNYTTYGWQLQAYMHLTGKKHATLAYVLTDSPEWLIEDEVRKAWYQSKIFTEEEQDYFDKEIAPRIRANHTYTAHDGYPEVPLEERVIEYELDYNPEAIKAAQERVEHINHIIKDKYNEIWK